MKEFTLTVKPIGKDMIQETIENVILPFIKDYFHVLYVGAQRIGVNHVNDETEHQMYVQLDDCKFFLNSSNEGRFEVINEGIYNDWNSPYITENDLIHVARTLQKLLDSAAATIPCNVSIRVENLM